MELTWEDPPADGRRDSRQSVFWHDVAAGLRSHPGAWAMVGRFSPTTAMNIKSGALKAFPRGEFEAVSRNTRQDDAKADIYARYVGNP